MTPDRWQQIKDLFHQALEQPAEARTAYLNKACNGDPDLRREVEALLRAHHDEPSFLEQHAVEALDLAEHPPAEAERVGPYRLLHQLGRGGMGTVYLAERDDGTFHKHVALKLIRRGLDTDDILSRFRYERQILASLDHPHIARLYDGGMTDDGRPYFVMEYVEGMPITTYCDAKKLSTTQRLALFRTVCRAVQHAHQNLIIHRDLKPSNILVTEDGTVKLLDFGIAKLLTDEGMAATVPMTRTGLRLMTPEYAAPEQVRGEMITTATDVYQLGVLLYELLTGLRPHRIEQRVQAEVERVILEEAPTRPSTALNAAETAAAVGAARGTTVERLRRQLAGDLDNIVLKALEKEVVRRYGTVEQLAEDVRRHGVGLPVLAQADTVGYRLRKFVQRHRGAVTAAGAVGVALLIGVIGMAWQARVAAAERDRAERERDRAEEVLGFTIDLFEQNDPNRAQGDTLTVRTVLDRGASQLAEATDLPMDTRARMQNVVGQVYTQLGLYDDARPLFAAALQQVSGEAASTPASLQASLHRNLATVFFETGLMDSALVHQERAVTLLEASPSLDLAQAWVGLGVIHNDNGDFDKAEGYLRDGLALVREVAGDESVETAQALTELGYLLHNQGNYEDAISAFEEALGYLEHHLPSDHLDIARVLHNLGNTLQKNGDAEASEPILRRALAIRRERLGPEHLYIGFTLNILAGALHDQERYEEAIAVYQEAIAVKTLALGEDNHYVISSMNNLANLYTDIERYGEAEAIQRKVVDLAIQYFGTEHPSTAMAHFGLAATIYQRGKYEDAAYHFRRCIAIQDVVLPEDHWVRYYARGYYGSLVHDMGDIAEAEPLLVDSFEKLRSLRGVDDYFSQSVLTDVIEFYTETGDSTQAAAFRELVVE